MSDLVAQVAKIISGSGVTSKKSRDKADFIIAIVLEHYREMDRTRIANSTEEDFQRMVDGLRRHLRRQ